MDALCGQAKPRPEICQAKWRRIQAGIADASTRTAHFRCLATLCGPTAAWRGLTKSSRTFLRNERCCVDTKKELSEEGNWAGGSQSRWKPWQGGVLCRMGAQRGLKGLTLKSMLPMDTLLPRDVHFFSPWPDAWGKESSNTILAREWCDRKICL